MKTSNIVINNINEISYLKTIQNNIINLILTDPPYLISRESGMNYIKQNEEKNNEYVKNVEN